MKENHFPPNPFLIFVSDSDQASKQNIALCMLSDWIDVLRSLYETIVCDVVEKSEKRWCSIESNVLKF
jgi:hypothetical protein